MKIMPLIIINIFAVMEIIGLAGDCHDFLRSLAHSVRLMAMTGLVAMTGLSLAKMIYFLAMIMAESLFLVFGIILISAFYLIEKLKKINLCQRFSVGEGEQK